MTTTPMVWIAECGRRYRWPTTPFRCGLCDRPIRCVDSIDIDGYWLPAGTKCAAQFRAFLSKASA